MAKSLLCFFLIIIPACLAAQPMTILRIDPDNARGGTASEIFDSIRFIPLETTDKSLFGSIDQMEVTDLYFIILDVRSHSILVFDKKGHLHTRIVTPGPGKRFSFFTINRNAGEIIAINNYAGGLLVYNYEGVLLRTEPSPDNIQSLYLFDNKVVLYNIKRSFNTIASNHVLFDLAYSNGYNSISHYVNPYNPNVEDGEYNIGSSMLNYSGENGSCMFSQPFYYRSYQMSDTGVIHKYSFVFPLQYSLPPNFATDSMFKNHRAEYVYTNHDNYKKIYSVEHVYKSGDYIFFAAASGQLKTGADWNYAYNLKNADLISFTRVTGDSSSCYFPIASTMLEDIIAVYGNKIYTSIPAFRLFMIKNSLNKEVNYPDVLNRLFSEGGKNSNSVIIEVQLKPNL